MSSHTVWTSVYGPDSRRLAARGGADLEAGWYAWCDHPGPCHSFEAVVEGGCGGCGAALEAGRCQSCDLEWRCQSGSSRVCNAAEAVAFGHQPNDHLMVDVRGVDAAIARAIALRGSCL